MFCKNMWDFFLKHNKYYKTKTCKFQQYDRALHVMEKFRTGVELFFAIWFVMGNVWVFESRFLSYHRAPKLHLLCISLLAWNAVTYSFPFLLFLLLCCCVPILSSFLGYNMNMGSVDRGASDEQLSSLPSWKYKECGNKEQPTSENVVSDLSVKFFYDINL